MSTQSLVSIAVLALLLFWAVGAYNRLVRLKNIIANAFGQIDVQLKRRYDLIPNLVEAAKKYLLHERETLEAVIQARSRVAGAGSVDEKMAANDQLSGALARLLVVVEQYPNLKANQNFLALQEELSSTENKISFSRQYYNDSVLSYNNKTQMFPSNVVAGMTGFKASEFFQVTATEEREPPKVSFTPPPAQK